MKGASWSFALIDSETGDLLFSNNAYKQVVPASVTKLVSTATALEMLGPDYRYETELLYQGEIVDSVLHGNLFLTGYGDPTLASSRFSGYPNGVTMFEEWINVIKRAGIKSVDGALIVDDSRFGSASIPRHWAWQDIGNYYGTGVGTVNYNENKLEITFSSGSTGSLTKLVSVYPKAAEDAFINEVVAGEAGSGDNAYVFGAPGQSVRYVRGTIPPNKSSFTIKASVPDPEAFVAGLFTDYLKKAGIDLSEGWTLSSKSSTSLSIDEMVSLHNQTSPTLEEIIQVTNHYSVNLYAEALLLRAKLGQTKEEAFPQSQEWEMNYWEARIGGDAPFYLVDGSGLSRANSFSAVFLCRLLAHIQNGELAEPFMKSLPLAGQSGTLRSLCKGANCAGKVKAKSGTMNRVRAYAGYIQGGSGVWYPFAIMVNNFEGSSSSVRSRISSLLDAILPMLD